MNRSLSVVFSTRHIDQSYIDHIKNTAKLPNIEILPYENNGERSLTEIYNDALTKATNDIVIFCHDDLIFETTNWANKILKHFHRNPEYGIIGLAGTTTLLDGRWWSVKKAMHGIVNHTDGKKTWTSKYSKNQGNQIKEMVVLDGIFLAVDKTKIKHTFDPVFQGFHFYDISFCLPNHLDGVKVGVITDILVTHKSIGETNDLWEVNKVIFETKYKYVLPVKIEETFEDRPLKILIGCLNFQGLTGSELSTLELAKGLAKIGCDVSVISSTIGTNFKAICSRSNIKTYLMTEPPGFKIGDGKWGFNTPTGFQPTQPNALYRVSEVDYDIIHANHTPITEALLQYYPECNFINIVRSEVISLENPVIDPHIKRYVAIRPSIKDHIVSKFNIPEDKVEVVYNAFDGSRFKKMSLPSGTDKPVTLFVGTMDYLREKAIRDLILKCEWQHKELWLVGKDSNNYAAKMAEEYPHVKYFPPTEKIEDFYYKCTETAGIMLGRTTIEGFLCGKPAIIYNVDERGEILNSDFHEVPDDLSIFKPEYVATRMKQIYIKAYNTN